MIPKKNRLSKKDIHDFFSKRSKVVHGSIISVRFQRNGIEKDRWAAVVSSAVKRNAPQRNTARRRIFAIVRSIGAQVPSGYDIIFSLKLKEKKSPSSKLLKDDMIRTLSLCKLFH